MQPKGPVSADVSGASKNTGKARGRPKGSAANVVYDGLRSDILHLRLGPGTDIQEAALQKRFGVSRTPVREALIRLASEDLVTLLPNRGSRVAEMDFAEVPRFFEALDVCQRLVLRLSAQRRSEAQLSAMRSLNKDFAEAARLLDVVAMTEINNQYHAVSAEACGNKYVRAFYEELLSTGLRLTRSAFRSALDAPEFVENYYQKVVQEHEAIIQALARRDADAAEELGRAHTRLFIGRIVRAIEAGQGEHLDLRKRLDDVANLD